MKGITSTILQFAGWFFCANVCPKLLIINSLCEDELLMRRFGFKME
jgi:hypothetical protein